MSHPSPGRRRRRERHSTLWHRVACEILRGATFAGPAPLQAPGLPYVSDRQARDVARAVFPPITLGQARAAIASNESDAPSCPRCGARRQLNVDGATVHAHLGRTLCDDGAPGPDSTDDEIRTWAHLCTRYTPDGYPYVPRRATS